MLIFILSTKQLVLKQAKLHMERAKYEQQFYKLQCQKSKEDLKKFYCLPDGTYTTTKCNTYLLSGHMTLHLRFDYAQQVHFPSDPMQPGPIYFLTPRKCGLFGVCCEGIPKQVNLTKSKQTIIYFYIITLRLIISLMNK